MARYIDADKLRKVIYSVADMPYDTIDFLHTIENFPTAEDVKPVVRGKWIEKKAKDGQRYLQCSVCERNKMDMTHDDFCKFCGADMEREG